MCLIFVMYDEEMNIYMDKGVQLDFYVFFIIFYNDGNNRLYDIEGFNYFYWDFYGFLYFLFI